MNWNLRIWGSPELLWRCWSNDGRCGTTFRSRCRRWRRAHQLYANTDGSDCGTSPALLRSSTFEPNWLKWTFLFCFFNYHRPCPRTVGTSDVRCQRESSASACLSPKSILTLCWNRRGRFYPLIYYVILRVNLIYLVANNCRRFQKILKVPLK